jgi:predicted nucleic acid-binding Zn ribbon protein
MRRIFEFACENGHRTDRLVVYETTNLMCECGATANRILSAPAFRLEGWSGHFPTAHAKFGKSHTDKLKSERKINS